MLQIKCHCASQSRAQRVVRWSFVVKLSNQIFTTVPGYVHSVHSSHPFHLHFAGQLYVWPSQKGLHRAGAAAEHSLHAPQPGQAHRSCQVSVLPAQNGLHWTGGSEEQSVHAPQPFHWHFPLQLSGLRKL